VGEDRMRVAGPLVGSEAVIPLGVSMVAHRITPIVTGIRPFTDRGIIQLDRAAVHRIPLRLVTVHVLQVGSSGCPESRGARDRGAQIPGPHGAHHSCSYENIDAVIAPLPADARQSRRAEPAAAASEWAGNRGSASRPCR
jgi:hypothetical protein